MAEIQFPETVTLEAQNLRVAYGDYVALQVPQLSTSGRVIAIIGHNGSGKSTMIKSILELLVPRTGEIVSYWQFSDSRLRLRPEEHMAFSPENGAVFGDLTVETYIKLWCRVKCANGNYYRQEGSDFIEAFNLSPLLRKLGRELSKGQRRRVQIAVGFLTNPRLFLLDEPFDGLDIKQSNVLANTLMEQAAGRAMILASHRMDLIERLADTIIVLKDGKVAAAGDIGEVCNHLCRQSVLITTYDEASPRITNLLQTLREQFVSCVVNQIGGQLSISGNDVDLTSLQMFLYDNQLTRVKIESVRASLIDAMNYHLNKLQ